jgi:hypothetical protein
MTTLKATIKGGRLELDVPPDWPDGTEVEIHPIQRGTSGASELMSPEEIAGTLAAMDQIEGFELTNAEIAAWEADRQARKEQDKARFAAHAEELQRQWE